MWLFLTWSKFLFSFPIRWQVILTFSPHKTAAFISVLLLYFSWLIDFAKKSNQKFHCTKMKFSIKHFLSKCDQMRTFLRIWSHLLTKSVMENFIFCAALLSFCLSFWVFFLTYLFFFSFFFFFSGGFDNIFSSLNSSAVLSSVASRFRFMFAEHGTVNKRQAIWMNKALLLIFWTITITISFVFWLFDQYQ